MRWVNTKESATINAINEATASTFQAKTNLALEQRKSSMREGEDMSGVQLKEWHHQKGGFKLTRVKILNEQGAKSMGKSRGTHLVPEADRLSKADDDYHGEILEELARQIQKLVAEMVGHREGDLPSVLMAGLGNDSVIPNSLGPGVLDNLQVTRHLDGRYGSTFLKDRKLPVTSDIMSGVVVQTGVETAEILKGIIHETHPDLIIVVDALAAGSVRHLGTTIQLIDTGTYPGLGVGNHRHSLTKESLGVPMMAIGVLIAVGAAVIVHDTVSTLVKVLAKSEGTRGTGSRIEGMGPGGQYQLTWELLEPEFGPLYVASPDIDQSVKQLDFTIPEDIHQAIFP